MKLIYVVYREDNVMVYESQVLEYLRSLKEKKLFESIELVVFRHEQNLRKKTEVEDRINKYINKAMTFGSFPVLCMAQLDINALRLNSYIRKSYSKDEQVAVVCRGDLAAYVAIKAFSQYPNSRILYDNRGLAYEESVMSHENNYIHKINREVKRKALNYSKLHCDMYNFVTNAMRDYFLTQYKYDFKIPFTIIPTLYSAEQGTEEEFQTIVDKEGYKTSDFVISYVGSTAAWQSTKQLINLFRIIGERYKDIRFFILSNGTIPEVETLSPKIKNRIVIKTVQHKEMKYYLRMTNIGIVIRDNNIVNHVAAPTKIAEYLTSGVSILYSGDIGIISDLKRKTDGNQMICIDTEADWLDRINPEKYPGKRIDPVIVDHFNMDKRQLETYEMITRAFASAKVK